MFSPLIFSGLGKRFSPKLCKSVLTWADLSTSKQEKLNWLEYLHLYLKVTWIYKLSSFSFNIWVTAPRIWNYPLSEFHHDFQTFHRTTGIHRRPIINIGKSMDMWKDRESDTVTHIFDCHYLAKKKIAFARRVQDEDWSSEIKLTISAWTGTTSLGCCSESALLVMHIIIVRFIPRVLIKQWQRLWWI